MILELGPLFAAAVGYLLLLFLIAYATERGVISQRVARHPLTYALSLGVYASSWTYYGSVGFAKANGYNFLTIYLGVTLSCLLVPVLWIPIMRVVRDHQLTSLADLSAFRLPERLHHEQEAPAPRRGFEARASTTWTSLRSLSATYCSTACRSVAMTLWADLRGTLFHAVRPAV